MNKEKLNDPSRVINSQLHSFNSKFSIILYCLTKALTAANKKPSVELYPSTHNFHHIVWPKNKMPMSYPNRQKKISWSPFRSIKSSKALGSRRFHCQGVQKKFYPKYSSCRWFRISSWLPTVHFFTCEGVPSSLTLKGKTKSRSDSQFGQEKSSMFKHWTMDRKIEKSYSKFNIKDLGVNTLRQPNNTGCYTFEVNRNTKRSLQRLSWSACDKFKF